MVVLILGFVITTLSIVTSLFEKWESKSMPDYKKKNKRALINLAVGIVGAIVSLFAGINAFNEKISSDKAAISNQKKLESQGGLIYDLENINHALLKTSLENSKALDSSSHLNYMLSKEIAKGTKDLKDYSSGIGSYCYVELGKGANLNNYSLSLSTVGVNPMENLRARIYDVYTETNLPDVDLGKVFPNTNFMIPMNVNFKSIKQDSIKLNIFFSTGNRLFTQILRSIRSHGKWLGSTTIIENDKVIFTKIDKNFPKDF